MVEQGARLAEDDFVCVVERDELPREHQLLVAADLVRCRLAGFLVRLIWDAQRFGEAEGRFLVVAESLEDLTKMKIVRYELIGGEFCVVQLLLQLSSLDLLLSKGLLIYELHAEDLRPCTSRIFSRLHRLGLLRVWLFR